MASELAPLEAFERYGSLGPDFLTWIFVRILDGEVPPIPSEPGLKLDVQGPLQFAAEDGDARKVTLAGTEAPTAPEVVSALRQGKRLMRAKLLLTAVEDTWTFTLDAETFDLRSIKLPVPVMPDAEAFLEARVEAALRLYLLLDELFEVFLPVRLSVEEWREELRRWTKGLGNAA